MSAKKKVEEYNDLKNAMETKEQSWQRAEEMVVQHRQTMDAFLASAKIDPLESKPEESNLTFAVEILTKELALLQTKYGEMMQSLVDLKNKEHVHNHAHLRKKKA